MLSSKRIFFVILTFFLAILLVMKVVKIYNDNAESKVAFSGIIISIDKYSRVYKVKLRSYEKSMVVLDYSYKDHIGLIHIGD